MEKQVKLWFDKAQADLTTIRILLKDSEHNAEVVCFHCQQAVEKYLKGFLVFRNIEFPKTHDLETLYGLCLAQDNHFGLIDRYQLAALTDYAVEARYPDEQYVPEEKEEHSFVQLTQQVKELVLKKIS